VFESVTDPLPVSRVGRVISGSALNSYICVCVWRPTLHWFQIRPAHASRIGSRREDIVSEIASAGHRRLPTSQSAFQPRCSCSHRSPHQQYSWVQRGFDCYALFWACESGRRIFGCILLAAIMGDRQWCIWPVTVQTLWVGAGPYKYVYKSYRLCLR
jgi:hypothetical protein